VAWNMKVFRHTNHQMRGFGLRVDVQECDFGRLVSEFRHYHFPFMSPNGLISICAEDCPREECSGKISAIVERTVRTMYDALIFVLFAALLDGTSFRRSELDLS
jgi:hypothetical protein